MITKVPDKRVGSSILGEAQCDRVEIAICLDTGFLCLRVGKTFADFSTQKLNMHILIQFCKKNWSQRADFFKKKLNILILI